MCSFVRDNYLNEHNKIRLDVIRADLEPTISKNEIFAKQFEVCEDLQLPIPVEDAILMITNCVYDGIKKMMNSEE